MSGFAKWQELTSPKVFWDRVELLPSGCWKWIGYRDRQGYGAGDFGGAKSRRAHRIAYEEVMGPIPNGMHLDHLCRNPWCVNPMHLEPVTPRENVMRGFGLAAINSRKTHCDRGHKFTTANTYMALNGQRICRTCKMHWARHKRGGGPRQRKTHCKRGHELAGTNIKIYDGRRHCQICQRLLKAIARAS